MFLLLFFLVFKDSNYEAAVECQTQDRLFG